MSQCMKPNAWNDFLWCACCLMRKTFCSVRHTILLIGINISDNSASSIFRNKSQIKHNRVHPNTGTNVPKYVIIFKKTVLILKHTDVYYNADKKKFNIQNDTVKSNPLLYKIHAADLLGFVSSWMWCLGKYFQMLWRIILSSYSKGQVVHNSVLFDPWR